MIKTVSALSVASILSQCGIEKEPEVFNFSEPTSIHLCHSEALMDGLLKVVMSPDYFAAMAGLENYRKSESCPLSVPLTSVKGVVMLSDTNKNGVAVRLIKTVRANGEGYYYAAIANTAGPTQTGWIDMINLIMEGRTQKGIFDFLLEK